MVMDQNPEFPSMGNIIHRYKHLLNLDSGPSFAKTSSSLKRICSFVCHRNNRLSVTNNMLYTADSVLVAEKARRKRERGGENPLYTRSQKHLYRLFQALLMQGVMPVVNTDFSVHLF